jgi:hypothetical protein
MRGCMSACAPVPLCSGCLVVTVLDLGPLKVVALTLKGMALQAKAPTPARHRMPCDGRRTSARLRRSPCRAWLWGRFEGHRGAQKNRDGVTRRMSAKTVSSSCRSIVGDGAIDSAPACGVPPGRPLEAGMRQKLDDALLGGGTVAVRLVDDHERPRRCFSRRWRVRSAR